MALFLADRALHELEDVLWWYEISAGHAVAAEMDARFRTAFDKIGEGILPGSPRIEWLPDRYRFSLMAPYWIVWRTEQRMRIVVAIVHAHRHVPVLLDDLE